MRHPSELTLQRFREDLLSSWRRSRVETHLQSCECCAEILKSYDELNHLLASYPSAATPPDLSEQILSNILKEDVSTAARESAMGRLLGLTGGLLALAVAGLLILSPVLGSVDSVLFAISRVVKDVALFGQGGLTVVLSLSRVLEPYWLPAQLLVIGAMATVALMAGRQLSIQ